jgi:hypothetical protein
MGRDLPFWGDVAYVISVLAYLALEKSFVERDTMSVGMQLDLHKRRVEICQLGRRHNLKDAGSDKGLVVDAQFGSETAQKLVSVIRRIAFLIRDTAYIGRDALPSATLRKIDGWSRHAEPSHLQSAAPSFPQQITAHEIEHWSPIRRVKARQIHRGRNPILLEQRVGDGRKIMETIVESEAKRLWGQFVGI